MPPTQSTEIQHLHEPIFDKTRSEAGGAIQMTRCMKDNDARLYMAICSCSHMFIQCSNELLSIEPHDLLRLGLELFMCFMIRVLSGIYHQAWDQNIMMTST